MVWSIVMVSALWRGGMQDVTRNNYTCHDVFSIAERLQKYKLLCQLSDTDDATSLLYQCSCVDLIKLIFVVVLELFWRQLYTVIPFLAFSFQFDRFILFCVGRADKKLQ